MRKNSQLFSQLFKDISQLIFCQLSSQLLSTAIDKLLKSGIKKVDRSVNYCQRTEKLTIPYTRVVNCQLSTVLQCNVWPGGRASSLKREP